MYTYNIYSPTCFYNGKYVTKIYYYLLNSVRYTTDHTIQTSFLSMVSSDIITLFLKII